MRRELYGIAEIAESLGLTRQTVTMWRRRRSFAMPDPDAELSSGPVWRSATIEPWINTNRSRLTGLGPSADLPLQPGDVKRAGRRLFRLAALLLEEPLRPQLVSQALTEVEELNEQIAQAADDETRQRLQPIVEPVATLARPDLLSDQSYLAGLAHQLLRGLPDLVESLVAALGDRREQRER